MSHFEHRAIDAFLYASYNERYIYIYWTQNSHSLNIKTEQSSTNDQKNKTQHQKKVHN